MTIFELRPVKEASLESMGVWGTTTSYASPTNENEVSSPVSYSHRSDGGERQKEVQEAELDQIWKLDFSQSHADRELLEAESQLERFEIVVAEADRQMREVRPVAVISPPASGAASFTVAGFSKADAPNPQKPSLQEQLRAELLTLRSPAPSFAVEAPEANPEAVPSESNDLLSFLNRVNQLLVPRVQVETRREGQLQASSSIAWNGKSVVCWAEGELHSATHHRSVQIVLRSRLALLALADTLLQGCAEIALKFSISPLAALPALYRFTQKLFEESRNFSDIFQFLKEQQA